MYLKTMSEIGLDEELAGKRQIHLILRFNKTNASHLYVTCNPAIIATVKHQLVEGAAFAGLTTIGAMKI